MVQEETDMLCKFLFQLFSKIFRIVKKNRINYGGTAKIHRSRRNIIRDYQENKLSFERNRQKSIGNKKGLGGTPKATFKIRKNQSVANLNSIGLPMASRDCPNTGYDQERTGGLDQDQAEECYDGPVGDGIYRGMGSRNFASANNLKSGMGGNTYMNKPKRTLGFRYGQSLDANKWQQVMGKHDAYPHNIL